MSNIRNRSAIALFTVLFPIAVSADMADSSGTTAQPDASLQKAIQQALYRIEPAGDGYSAENPGQRLTARFGGRRSEFTYRNHRFSLALTGAGPVVKTRAKENRVEFDHYGITE